MRVARFIDEQVAEQAVGKPRRRRVRRAGRVGKRDFELVKLIVPGLPVMASAHGPMKSPRRDRKAKDGAAMSDQALSKSGRRNSGESTGVGPPSTI